MISCSTGQTALASITAKPLSRPLALLVVGFALTLALTGESVSTEWLALPVRFDCGSDHPTQDHRGRIYLADQEWSPQAGAGYIGGYRVWSGKEHPVDGTPDPSLHTNQRHNWEEYRFSNIPDGDYLVTLTFSEIGTPAYTVFHVAIEGQIVLRDLRIFDHVGGNYALTRRFGVTVTDGELNVAALRVVGDPRLAAIEVEARSPDLVAPATPTDLAITSSYYALLLDWADNTEDDLDGYHVYRAPSPGGPHTRLTAEPTHVSRYQDSDAAAHVTYHYCISGVDIYGNESEPTPCLTGIALDESDATLPLLQLEIPPENLRYLYDHVFSDDEATGSLTYRGRVFPVAVRYRGGYGRFIHKKSWKIKFPNGSPFPGRSEVNLRGDYLDQTLMHTKLSTALYEAAGVQVPQAEHVLLTHNGQYLGVYTLNEQVDEGYLARTGQNPNVSIYKAVHTDTHDWSEAQPSEGAYHGAYEKKTNVDTSYDDVIAFIELINDAPDETFAYQLGRVFDVAAYLDYYAVTVLISNGDFVHHNVYLLHDATTGQWALVPYDFDVTFIKTDRPINEGTAASPIQPREWVSVLLTRVLDVPQFRAYYCHRLAEFLDTLFSDAAMHALIDRTYADIEQDVLRDWHKHHREDNSWFVASPDELRAYVAQRRDFLRDQIPAYCTIEGPFLAINEITGGAGEPPAGLEIYNRGLEAVDLGGMVLTDDLSDPKFRTPDGLSISPGGFITFYADGRPRLGPLHTNFELSETGGEIGIFSGTQQIDAHAFGPRSAGLSQGRYPDGADNWRPFHVPTPGSSNLLLPPTISGTARSPWLPTESDIVTVTAIITDDHAVLTTTLHYSATGGAFAEVGMTGLGGDRYAARIPAQPAGTLVEYYVSAGDSDGQTSVSPRYGHDRPYRYIVDYEPPPVVINEFQADNESTLCGLGAPDDCPDWIELYNPGPGPIDLGGRYLTDDLDNPIKFRIADGVIIPVGGHLLFYADGSPERGPLHANFKLRKDGESVGLFDIDAADNHPIDTYAFGLQPADGSEGRCPDGNTWAFFATPTPGEANPCGTMPLISSVSHAPPIPSATDEVTITAVIVGEGSSIEPTLWYSVGASFVAVPMTPVETADDLYAATIPAWPGGQSVAYYVRAESARGQSATDPPGAPGDAHHYLVGYRPPALLINEFMADNAATLEDPDDPGEFPDWIELHNSGPTPIDLGGKHLTDDLADPTKFRIADGITIPPGGFALFYADDDPEQGPLHTNFRLSRVGGRIGLFDSDATGNQLIDEYTYGLQVIDASERRCPDGGEAWAMTRTPTPGKAGIDECPQ